MSDEWADKREHFLSVVFERVPDARAQLDQISKLPPALRDPEAEEWAHRLNLQDADWVTQKAINMVTRVGFVRLVERFHFSCQGRASTTSRPAARKEIEAAFKKALNAYLDATDENERRDKHYAWLVAYQVEKLSYEKIEADVKRERAKRRVPSDEESEASLRQGITEAVKNLASDIGLPLRKQGSQ